MTSRDFCYWLQGFFELGGEQGISKDQSAAIRRHLAMAFAHEIDPSHGDAAHRAKLSEIHDVPSGRDKRWDVDGPITC